MRAEIDSGAMVIQSTIRQYLELTLSLRQVFMHVPVFSTRASAQFRLSGHHRQQWRYQLPFQRSALITEIEQS
jgi:hypothetical protein